MTLPSPQLLGAVYGTSEICLALARRSGSGSTKADKGSLRLLWGVILCSIGAALALAYAVPAWHSMLLHRAYAAGVALFAAGVSWRWYAILSLGRFFTVNVAIAADHRVVDTGPYRLVRHPSYTGALAAFLGIGVCMGNWGSLLVMLVPVTAAFVRRIGIEEDALRGALGADYAAYERRTKRLIPFVY